VYLDNKSYLIEGVESLPKELFILSDEISPMNSYNIALNMDPTYIQKSYEQNHNIDLCSQGIK
jgi:hypothetical protein